MRHLIVHRLGGAGSCTDWWSVRLTSVARSSAELRAPSCRPPVFCSTELRATVQSVISSARTRSGQTPPNLLLEHLFDLSDLFLNFAGRLFDFAFHFMNSAFNLIFRAGVHLFSPCG